VFHYSFGEGLVVEIHRRGFHDILEIVFAEGVRKITSAHPLLLSQAEYAKQQSAGPAPSPARKSKSTSVVTLDEESWRIIRNFKDGSGVSPERFSLLLQAESFSLEEGFRRLLCLDSLRNVERYPHQIEACLKVLRKMRGRALLADEVGLGKTIEAGIILKELMLRGLIRTGLILTPSSLTAQWLGELKEKFCLQVTPYRRGSNWKDEPFLLASLDTAKMTRHARNLGAKRYDIVVVDEAHRLRNHLTLGWKFLNKLQAKYLLLLTATPVQNNLRELFNLVSLLRPGSLGGYRSFRRQFMAGGDKRFPKNTERLSRLLSGVMIRTTRSGTAIRLPRRHVETIVFTLSPPERELYDRVAEFVRRMARPNERQGQRQWYFTLLVLQKEMGSTVHAAQKTLEAMLAKATYREQYRELEDINELALSITESAKLKRLLAILSTLQERVIVFTQFKRSLDFLRKELEQRGFEVAQFHGELSPSQKAKAVMDFKRSKRILLSTEAGGEGQNLHFCSTIVNYDLPWNPMKVEQRIGRVHRLGQTKDVKVYNLSTEDTVESYVLEILDRKINMFQLVVGEIDLILGNMKDARSFEDRVFRIWASTSDRSKLNKEFASLAGKLLHARKQYDRIKELDARLFNGKTERG